MTPQKPSCHRKVVILINLGTPESTKVSAVRRYLYEFLMDPAVIDIPYYKRLALVGGIIAPFRAFASSKAYREVWTEEGSPLLVFSKQLQQKLQAQTTIPIFLAMRYGKPDIETVLSEALAALEPNETGTLQFIPLYPHHAMSTTLTVYKKIKTVLAQFAKQHPKRIDLLTTLVEAPFYHKPAYLNALATSIKPYTQTLGKKLGGYDAILFSYHGTPKRHLNKVDHTKHCMIQEDCCIKPNSEAHAICYKHQVVMTTRSITKKLGLPKERVLTAFQSRLGKNWLTPYTDEIIKALPSRGIKKLLVVTPAFVSDNLETLFEVAIENEAFFKAAGGETLTLIPCLNTSEPWIDCLMSLINEPSDFTSTLERATQTLAHYQ